MFGSLGDPQQWFSDLHPDSAQRWGFDRGLGGELDPIAGR